MSRLSKFRLESFKWVILKFLIHEAGINFFEKIVVRSKNLCGNINIFTNVLEVLKMDISFPHGLKHK